MISRHYNGRNRLELSLGRACRSPARAGDAGLAKGGLHQMNGCAEVEGVRSMRVAEPVGRNGEFDAGATGCSADNARSRPPLFLLRERKIG